jgi:hypothetical protein
MSDGRKLDVGDTVGDFEVTAVQYQQDNEGNHINFGYIIRDAKELQAEREAQAEALAAIEATKSDTETE